MKKFFSIMLALVMVLGIMSVGTMAADIATYNFDNSSTTAEALSADFMLSDHSGAFRHAISTEKAHSGTTSLAATGTSSGDMYIKIPNPAVGVTYTLSAWYYTEADAKLALFIRTAPVAGTQANSVKSGTSVATIQSAAAVPTKGEWAQYTKSFELTQANYNKLTDGMYLMFRTSSGIIYIDDIEISDDTAAPSTPDPAPTEYDVTITAGANANASVSAATSEGEAVNFTVAPKFGYYIQSITIGGTPFTGFDAYKGGTYTTGAIAADTAIVVTVAELSANTADGVSTAVATLPAVFAETGEAPVTFGKVLADVATVDEFGIYLTTAEGDEVESAVTKMGPHFKAFYNVNGQYAIEFQGLAAGEYVAKTYVKVAGVTTYGIATTFTVAE